MPGRRRPLLLRLRQFIGLLALPGLHPARLMVLRLCSARPGSARGEGARRRRGRACIGPIAGAALRARDPEAGGRAQGRDLAAGGGALDLALMTVH
jgi:hypothetical protein